MKKQTAYFLLRDRRKHQRTEQGVSKGSAAPGAEMPAVGAGCLSGVSLPRHTACPGRSAPAGQQQQQLAQPRLALGAGGRRAGHPPYGRGTSPAVGRLGRCSPCRGPGATGRGVLHPAPAELCAVGCSLSPATTAGLLRPRSCRDSGGVKPRRARGRALWPGTGRGAGQMPVLREPGSSRLQARVAGLPVLLSPARPVCHGQGPVRGLRGTCRAAPSPVASTSPSQSSHSRVRPLSGVPGHISTARGPLAARQTLSCPFLAPERQSKERGASDDINFTFCSRTQQTKETLRH